MPAIYLSEGDVAELLPIEAAMSAVEAVLRMLGLGQAMNQPRQRVNIGMTNLNVMSAAIPALGVLGAKNYTGGVEGGPRAYFLLFAANGDLISLMDADELGRIRTGATTGIGTKYLSRPDSKVAALIGTGFQAETQLRAMCVARRLEQVRVWSRRPDAVREFCERLQKELDVQLLPADDPRAAVDGADIVTTITTAKQPVLFGEWLSPGTHVNAAGNNRSFEREIDSLTVARSEVIFADSVAQSQIESGDLVLAAKDGVEVWDRVGELANLVAGRAAGRTAPGQITLFKSNGLALEDVAAAHYVYQEALRKGMGQPLPF
jgi:alanine dehydrogenase